MLPYWTYLDVGVASGRGLYVWAFTCTIADHSPFPDSIFPVNPVDQFMAALSAAEDIVSDGESPPELPLGATERDRSGETLLRTVSRLCGEISLNSYEVTVGDVVTVQWYVSPDTQGNPGLQPSERDWIGLFSISMSLPLLFPLSATSQLLSLHLNMQI